jgi:hypothetical protein
VKEGEEDHHYVVEEVVEIILLDEVVVEIVYLYRNAIATRITTVVKSSVADVCFIYSP